MIVLEKSTTGNDLKQCIEMSNIHCENCVVLDISLSTGSESIEYVIGDYQTYNISINNIGNNNISTNFSVKVLDPQGNQIGKTRSFPLSLQPNEIKNFIPNQTVDGKLFDIYPFDAVGSYKIVISTDTKITFYRFFPKMFNISSVYYFSCKFTFQENFVYNYDVISKSDEQWRNTLRGWQNETQNFNNESQLTNSIMKNLNLALYIFAFITLIVSTDLNNLIKKNKEIFGVMIFAAIGFLFFEFPQGDTISIILSYITGIICIVTAALIFYDLLFKKKGIKPFVISILINLFIFFVICVYLIFNIFGNIITSQNVDYTLIGLILISSSFVAIDLWHLFFAYVESFHNMYRKEIDDASLKIRNRFSKIKPS